MRLSYLEHWQVVSRNLADVEELDLLDEVEISPVLGYDGETFVDRGSADEGIRCIRRIVVILVLREDHLGDRHDALDLVVDHGEIGYKRLIPLAFVVVSSLRQFESDSPRDGQTIAAHVVDKRRDTQTLGPRYGRGVKQKLRRVQRARAAFAERSARYSRGDLRVPSGRRLISRRTRAISATEVSPSVSPSAAAARSADTTCRLPIVVMGTPLLRRSACVSRRLADSSRARSSTSMTSPKRFANSSDVSMPPLWSVCGSLSILVLLVASSTDFDDIQPSSLSAMSQGATRPRGMRGQRARAQGDPLLPVIRVRGVTGLPGRPVIRDRSAAGSRCCHATQIAQRAAAASSAASRMRFAWRIAVAASVGVTMMAW